ncbi:MAG TPA: tetratricopeptide repeat protein [Sediminibacterium sp.]|nr:tetratricopeptide repeat protein [Sediminibacterium sp.]
MYRIAFILIAASLLLVYQPVAAQLTQTNIEPDAAFKQAKLLYQQEQYSLAYPLFKTMYSNGIQNSNMPVQVQTETRFYYIICGLQLNEPNAEALAREFIELEPDIAHEQIIGFYLGEYYYRRKDYGNALEFYGKSNIANLNNRQIAEMKFHQGYAYFVLQQFDKAMPLFNSIRQLPKDPNYFDANYYYGFLLFGEKKYAEAIPCFLIAEKEPAYQEVVPFYLAELYYFNGDRDKALSYGETALQKGGQYYDLQLKQLVGHIWFEKRKFDKALPYLEQFATGMDKIRREDLYELSYCYYEAKNWKKSIEGFKQIGGAADSLAQNSMYLLADTYLKVNDRQNARNAFQFCAANNSNPSQKQVSSFHYAKLSYDLGYYGIAADSLRSFVAAYPSSVYRPEANELLISTLAHTSNYKDGLALYEQLPNRSDNAVRIYPALLYGRAVELINDHQTAAAEQLLDQLLTVSYNTAILPMANFWKGELAYRAGKTDLAISYLQNYLKNPSRNGEVNSTNARYNLAYCYLKKENYRQAREQFEMVSKSFGNASDDVVKDAYLRRADCHFMAREYKQALNMYEQVILSAWPAADYAIYQKAIIAGAQNRQNEKLQLLTSIERQYPKSLLLPGAQMEIANTYLADEAFDKAVLPLHQIIDNDAAAAIHPQAYLKLGIAQFNLNKNDAALDQFKFLVSKFPNSPETEAAVDYIRNIFIEKQQPSEYIGFMQANGKQVTATEADSLTYRAAMIRYEAKDNAGAQSGFTEYLLKFPEGRYALESNYFLAEINVVLNNAADALPFYTRVAARSPNIYAERSALQAARILYFDQKNYAEASRYFALLKKITLQQENRLEAMRGLLRCQFRLQEWKDAAPNAAELLEQKGIAADDRLMAGFSIARNEQLNNRPEQAIKLYQSLLTQGKSEITAEAQYRVAELLLQLNKLNEAEKAGFEVIKKFGSYDFWVTRSYILIGDVYFKQNDLFNAEATYKSVADNATIPELQKEAADKLARVIALNNKNNKVD